MITRRIVANLVVFFALSGALIVYGAVTLFGNPLRDKRTVVADLPDAGGLRAGFSASHDGVVIGTVKHIALHGGGVRVTVELDPGVTVPSGVEAKVVRASAVGEQRLDFGSGGAPTGSALPDGAVVPAASDPIPPDVADVLATTNRFIDALPGDDLNTLVHELSVGLDGRAEDLKAINRSLATINDDVIDLEPDLEAVLADGPKVLDAFTAMSPEAHRALANTQTLTGILASRDQDLVRLLGDGADLSTLGDRILTDDRASLTCLTHDVAGINHAIQGQALADLDRALAINGRFFGVIDKVAVRGAAADVGYGPAQSDALWLRARLLVPPESPPAMRYSPPRAPRPVVTGAACHNRFGSGSDAVAAPSPVPVGDDAAHLAGSTRRSPAIGAPPLGSPSGGPTDTSPAGHHGAGPTPLVPLLLLGTATVAALAIGPARSYRRRNP